MTNNSKKADFATKNDFRPKNLLQVSLQAFAFKASVSVKTLV